MTSDMRITSIELSGRPYRVITERPSIAAFWKRAAAGEWEDDTFHFVKAHVDSGTIFVDIGAWIGPITLAATAAGAKVIALEPDPTARSELIENVALNYADVEILAAAIDLEPGVLTLYAPAGLGESVTSSFANSNGIAVETPVVTFDDIATRIPNGVRVVIKMDIEGHEYRVIDALIAFAAEHKAPLHLSLHPASIYADLRRSKGWLVSRLETYRRTCDLLMRLEAALGPATLCESGRRCTSNEVLRKIVLKRRPKNFTVETMRN
jgi:FkbM family methyltransferase